MVRQQIGFLMLVVAATAGIMVISTIADIVKQWKTMSRDGKIGGCLMVVLLLLAAITTAALGILL